MPTQSELHVDELLSNVGVAYFQDADTFIASKVFPDVPVAKQSDRYPVIPAGAFNRDTMEKRADGTESVGDNFAVSSDSYFCDVWALHKDIGDQQRANADNQFRLESNTTRFLAGKSLIRKEKIFSDLIFETGSAWTGSTSGAALTVASNWNADPVGEVKAQSRSIYLKTGRKPNTLVVSADVHDGLVESTYFSDRAQYGTQTNGVYKVTNSMIKDLFEVENYYVLEGVINTASEGAADTNEFIGNGSVAWLGYVANSPALEEPSAGYTFSWSGFLGAAGMGTRVRKFRLDTKSADRVEIEMAFDMKRTCSDCGALFTNITFA